jgi:CubicO group peptidase (beta-lactamase class C family)
MRAAFVNASLFLLLAVVGHANPPQAGAQLPEPARAFLASVDQTLREDVAADGLGGLSIALIIGDEIVWQRAHGLADVAAQRATSTDTIYRVGSISKSVTALLLARLVDDDVIQLDYPVRDSLVEFVEVEGDAPDDEAVTFRQLASHTAGLVREPGLAGAATGPID